MTVAPPHDVKHHFPQAWLLLISLIGFGLYVVLDQGYLAMTLSVDRSYMAALTLALAALATVHCGWHIAHYSNYIIQLHHGLNCLPYLTKSDDLPTFLQTYLAELEDQRSRAHRDSSDDMTFDIQAERMRAPAELGWFFVDLAIRLGLLGTIIGFILIFASLDEVNIDGGDDLKNLLIAMSGGMGTALLTTLTGLVAASALSFQYLILDRETEYLNSLLFKVQRRYLSLLETDTEHPIATPEPPTATYPEASQMSTEQRRIKPESGAPPRP